MEALDTLLSQVDPTKPVVVLTGAGISVESGIPTFRGPQGYWTVGSQNFTPMKIGTWAHFSKHPEQVWCWYLFRRAACHAAQPNAGHLALVELEQRLGERFALITQNVDGLHVRAGNSPERVYEVHGNGDRMRVGAGYRDIQSIPFGVGYAKRGDQLLDEQSRALLTVDGRLARPHILWFDEVYEEPLHRSDSAMEMALQAGLFITVGSSGATNLPLHAASAAAQNGAVMLDINPNANPFSQFVEGYEKGAWLKGSSSQWLPEVVARIR